MKKYISLTLVLILLITALPINVFAVEQNSSERDELISLACEVFPEYASIIRGETLSAATWSISRDPTEIVVSETRTVSDNREINYTQFSNGIAYLSDVTFSYTKYNTSVETEGNDTRVTMSIKVTCNDSEGVFTLTNVKYTTSRSTYDAITSAGTPSKNSYSMYERRAFIAGETATQHALIEYNLTFLKKGATNWFYSYGAEFILTVGDNGMNIQVIYPY